MKNRVWTKTIVEHGLSESVLCVHVHSVDVEVAEHGIGFPTSKQELDGLLVHVERRAVASTSRT